MLWTEEFRPKKFEDVIGLTPIIPNLVKNNNIMHLLLVGSPGTGKTTTAKIIIDHYGADFIVLNASDERKIDVIRNKVKTFAMTMSTNKKSKIIFFDEADGLTKDSQEALRNLMETYADNCKFILTANYENRIIDALKSRCSIVKFELPNSNQIVQRLKYIANEKKLKISEKLLEKLTNKYYPDIRSCVKMLQEFSFLNKEITLNDVLRAELQVEELFNKLQSDKFTSIRQWMLDLNIDYKEILLEMRNYIWKNKENYKGKLETIFQYLVDCNRNLSLCAIPAIEFEWMIFRLMIYIQKS